MPENSTELPVFPASPALSDRLVKRRKEGIGLTGTSDVRGDSSPNRYTDLHSPKCRGCNRRWKFPRQADFIASIPTDARTNRTAADFFPATKDCVVAYQTWDRGSEDKAPYFRDEVYDHLKLTHTTQATTVCQRWLNKGRLQHHRLVTDFDYNRKTGDVIHKKEFSEDESEQDYRYAQLVTLCSWYKMLLFSVIRIIIDVFSHATTVMLIVQLGSNRKHAWVEQTLVPFTCMYATTWILAIYFAVEAARWEWQAYSNPNVGDIIVKCHSMDQWIIFIAMVTFIILSVDKLVKEIVIVIHPWKSIQPYAAVKLEGTRIHLVGYKSRSLFHVENATGQYHTQCVQTISKFIILSYKVLLFVVLWKYSGEKPKPTNSTLHLLNLSALSADNCTIYENLGEHSGNSLSLPSIIASALASGISFSAAAVSLYKLWKERKVLKEQLCRILKNAHESDQHKLMSAGKLLALHFHEEFENQVLRKVTREEYFKKSKEGECPICGRKEQADGVITEAHGSRHEPSSVVKASSIRSQPLSMRSQPSGGPLPSNWPTRGPNWH